MKNPKWLTVLVVLGLLLGSVATIGAVAGQQPEKVKVLIGFARQPGPAEEALVRGVGGTIRYTYHLVPAIAATVPERAIDGLRRNPNVTSVDLDGQVWAIDAELDNAWGVKHIGAGSVHDSGNKGTGVKVAIIDSGIDYNHPDLDANYAGGYDFVNSDTDPMDDYGHGTHVVGTVAAEDNGVGVVGVAPGASLYALKVLDASGGGYYSDVIAALEWAVKHGIRVTNNSYGSSGDPGGTVKAAFDNAYAAGILNVCAAGNSGNPPGRGDNVIYPARYVSCIAVAATKKDDTRARFSSTGPDLELSAPGVDVNSTWLGGGYHEGSGTSMASPHVAGTAALVWVAYPSWTNADVRTQLQNTADDLGPAGKDDKYGFGLVDADEAAVPPGPVNDPPTVSITSPVDGSTFDSGATILFEGTASDPEDGDLTASLSWTSSIDGPIGTGGSFSTTLSDGNHTITASVTDSGGKTGSASISITVSEPPAEATMHVGDLDGEGIKLARGNWRAIVTITVHDANEGLADGATVTGTFYQNGTFVIEVSCITGADWPGTCIVDSTQFPSKGGKATFTVDNVTHDTLQYDETANHDPDGDSDGTTITVSK